VVIAVGIASILGIALASAAPSFGIAPPVCGIALGAFLAGKWAKYAGAYHGGLVAVGYVIVEAIGLAPPPLEARDAGLAEGLLIILGDVLLLLLGALVGRIAAPVGAPSSFSDRDRGR
jgi:hypothetical protein